MTLKEKFKNAAKIIFVKKENIFELIADEYALEFAKWYVDLEEFDNKAEFYLKQFKEQKGL